MPSPGVLALFLWTRKASFEIRRQAVRMLMAATEIDGPELSEDAGSEAPAVEIVVPVHNEAAVIESSIRTLHRHLSQNLLHTWQITVADNASTDGTRFIARTLAEELAGVRVLSLPLKGRGRALRAAWSRSSATVVAYMDVDLSTDLSALEQIIEPILAGECEIAIGTRLAPGARVVRGRRREILSRGYNTLLRTLLRAHFSDAQCGFKALRGDVARSLLPAVRDESWFFDTEILMLAQRSGLRIAEVPVSWVEDPDSSVDLPATILEDLRGIARLIVERRAPTVTVASPRHVRAAALSSPAR
jgi:glycosyltransferase involved in cell wall biosynthesis